MSWGSHHFALREALLKSVVELAGEEPAWEGGTTFAYRFHCVQTEGAGASLPGNHLLQTAARTSSTAAILETPTLVAGFVRRGGRRSRLLVGPANGLEVNPRGQGPHGYGSAARRMPALEARNADGVTPRKLRRTSRLGRRAEAGPRRVLPRVSRLLAAARPAHFQGRSLRFGARHRLR